MKTQKNLVRPVIVIPNPAQYVVSLSELRDYFIANFPNLNNEVNRNKTSFKFELSSKVYDEHLARVESGKNTELSDTVMRHIFGRCETEEFDVKITLEISINPSIGISLLHKRSWGINQAEISFFDYSEEIIKIPGGRLIKDGPEILSTKTRSYFLEVIGFFSDRKIAVKKALDTIEKVLEEL